MRNVLIIILICMVMSCDEDKTSITDGLIAHYPFDGDAKDKTGNNPDGEVIGAMPVKDRNGRPGLAYHFKILDEINLGNILDDLEMPFTVSAWIKPVHGNNNIVLVTQDNTDVNGGFVFFASVGSIGVSIGDGVESELFRARGKFKFGLADNKDRWTHVCAVVQSLTEIHLFVDGKDVGGDYTGESALPMDSHFPDHVATVGILHNGEFSYAFNGDIDDLKVWGRALNAEEVLEAMK